MNEGFFKNSEGQQIYTVNWPVAQPKAVIVLVHGIGEHSRRYDHVAAALNQAGYAVYALDHRGHGKSEGMRVYFDSFDQPVADLKQYVDTVRAQHPGTPLYIYGHSMGSLISTLFVLRYQDMLAGFITSGSPLNIDTSVPAPVSAVLRVVAGIVPKAELLALGVEGISRDPKVVAAYQADPLVNQRPLRLGIVARMADSAKAAREQLPTLRLPMLILHGDADKVTPIGGSEYLYQHAGSQDKTYKVYPGLYHEVHNEPEQAQVLADVVAWLNVRTETSS